MSVQFSEMDDVDLRRLANRGRQVLQILGFIYFGFNGILLLGSLAIGGVGMFSLGLIKLLGAVMFFTFLYQGYNGARILIGIWAALMSIVLLLNLMNFSPESIATRIFLNLLIVIFLGLAAIFFFSPAIQAFQYLKRKERAKK